MKAANIEVIRLPAVAGTFYPQESAELRALVVHLLEAAAVPAPETGAGLKALIAPHAGYIYSGPVAASAFAQVRPIAAQVRRVVLLGPSHRVPFDGIALCRADAFGTPLGLVPVDREIMEELGHLPEVTWLDLAHKWEHSLEVELPFLQVVLGEFSIVPLVIGSASDVHIAALLDRLWDANDTLIVVSSDLSHYYEYATAQRIDRATADAIEALVPEDISNEQACGRAPIRGLLRCARDRKLRVQTLDLRNSGDTSGRRDRVVGYGAFAFHAE